MNKEALTLFIKNQALQLGFDHCGIAKAAKLDDDARRLEKWLTQNMHGNMQYMENHFDLRVDPTQLVPGAKSVVTLLINYFPEKKQKQNSPKISKYAFGKDYHDVIRKKTKALLELIRKNFGEINGRGFVDSAPVLERSWAVHAGLGWIGKNGNIINKKNGSFFFIATLIIDVPLIYDQPIQYDHCGSCTKCIDACPTDAILPNKVINGSKCISYFTIELKEALIPKEVNGKFDNWLFGCDVCQDVCPWNRFAKTSKEPAFEPLDEIIEYSHEEWEALTEEKFNTIFKDSPIKRANYIGIRRNLHFINQSINE